MRPITFAIAVNDRNVLRNNLLSSPCFGSSHTHEILEQVGFTSAAVAYNRALELASNDLVVFAHQDLFLPQHWLTQLERSLEYLERFDPEWGVLGCWGAKSTGELVGHIYSTGLGVIGQPFERPVSVQALDEIVLIMRKSSGLRFDANLPHFHFYGTDICLSAKGAGRESYAISAFCVHNTRQLLVLPKEFYSAYDYIRSARWKNLPIRTTCIEISRLNLGLYFRKLNDIRLTLTGRDRSALPRSLPALELWEQLGVPVEGSGR